MDKRIEEIIYNLTKVKEMPDSLSQYALLTNVIIALGKVREKTLKKAKPVYRKERKEKSKILAEHWVDEGIKILCCDCSLLHLVSMDDFENLFFVPYRPKFYNYKTRIKQRR